MVTSIHEHVEARMPDTMDGDEHLPLAMHVVGIIMIIVVAAMLYLLTKGW